MTYLEWYMKDELLDETEMFPLWTGLIEILFEITAAIRARCLRQAC